MTLSDGVSAGAGTAAGTAARRFIYITATYCEVKKPSPRGEGGSAYAESDEGLTYPKDHLNKECKALP